MSFRTKKSLDMYCKSSYILLVVAACAVTTGGEKSSATVGKTKVISTTGTGGTSSLQRLGSGGLGSSSQLQRTSSLGSGSLSSTGTGNATVGSTRRLSISSVGSGVSQQSGLVVIDPSSGIPTGKVQHKYGVSAGDFNVSEVPGGINPGERYVQFTNTKGKLVTYKEGLSTKLKLLWNESEIGRDHYIGSDGKVHAYIYRSSPNWVSGADILNAQGGDGGSSSLPQQQGNISSTILGSGNRSVGTQTDTGNLGGLGTPKKDTGTSPTTKKYTSQLNLNVDKDGNITKQNKGTNTGDGAGLGTNDGISKTQLNVNGDGKVVSRSIGTNTGTPSVVSETELNIDGSGKVTTRSVGTNTESVGETTSVVTPLGGDKDFFDSSTQTVISGSGLQPKKSTNKGVETQTDQNITGEGLTSLVAKSDGSQTSSGDGGSIPVKSVVYNFDKIPRFVPKGSESDTVKPSTGSQTSSQGDGDGGSSPVKSVVYNFDKMPKFTAKGNESDTGKTSTSVGTDVTSGGEKTTKPLTDTGSGGDGKTYTSTLRINIGGKGQQSTGGDEKEPQNKYLAGMAKTLGSLFLRKDVDDSGNIITTDYTKSILGTGQPEVVSIKPAAGNKETSGSGVSSSLGQQNSSTQTGSGAAAQGSSGSSPSGSRGASLEQQSSSSQTGSGAAAQGGSGSSTSGNKGALSSGQQGQGSLSQQSASGSGAQGGSGDGSGGKRTPSSPVSGQTTSSSAQIEVKDEEGKTHQAVLVNTKGTSGGGASKKPSLSTIVEEGDSSKAIGEQGKKSSSTQTGGAGAQKGSGASTSGSRGASLGQQSSSSQTGSGAGAQGSSGSSTSGKGASSSGQQGQGSSSQQSASGSGAQGGSGDGSGGKKTPPSGQQGGDEDGIFVSKKDAEKFKPMYVGKSLEELMKMSNGELRDYFLKRNPEDDFKGIDLSAAKGLTGDELDEFVNTRPVITYELDGNGYTIIEVNNTAHILGTGGKVTRKAFGKLPDGRVVESIFIDRYVGGYRDAVESSRHSSSTTSTGTVSQGGNTTGTVPSGQTAQFETSGGAGAQGASGASAGGSKASSSSSAQKEQGKKGTGDSSSKSIYVGTSLKDLQGLNEEELINYSKNAPIIDWNKVKLALPKASTEEEAKDFAKKNPVYTYEVDDLGDLVEVNNSRWLYGVGEKTISKVFDSDGNPLDISNLEVRFRPYLSQKGDSKASSTGSKASTSGSGAQGSGGASQKEGSDSSSTTGNQGGSKVGTSVVGETGQTSTSGKAGTQASSEVNKGGSKTSSTSVEQQKQWDGSGKVDFGEVKKSLKPVSGTTTGKETQGSEGIDLNEAKKNLRPVSGSGAGTQKTGGDYEGDNKQSSSLGGKQTQSGNDDGKYKAVLVTVDEEGESSQIIGQQQTQGSKDVDSGTSGGKQKPTVTVLGYSLNELKALTQEQVIKIANDVNKVEFNKVSLNVPKFTSNKEAEDFAKYNPIYSVGVDQNGDIVVVNHSLKYLGVGNSIVIEKHKRNSDGNFTSKRVLEVFRPYVHKTSTDDSGNTTVTVSSGSTPKFVTSVVKIEQASSEAVEGKKSSASLLGKQTQQGSSSETVVEQKQSSLKKGSTTTTTDKSSGSSGGIDFDEAKKKLKPVTQSEKSGGESSGAVTQTELQIAIASLKKTGSIGQGMYDSDSDDDNDNDISKYILLGKSYGTSGGRGQIDFQKNVSTDETLVSSQGKPGFVKAVGQVFNTMSNEDGKIKVSNQTGSINIYTETDESGDLKINTSTTSKNLEDGIGLLNVDPKFAKTLARNIEEGYQKKLQEMESKGLSQ